MEKCLRHLLPNYRVNGIEEECQANTKVDVEADAIAASVQLPCDNPPSMNEVGKEVAIVDKRENKHVLEKDGGKDKDKDKNKGQGQEEEKIDCG